MPTLPEHIGFTPVFNRVHVVDVDQLHLHGFGFCVVVSVSISPFKLNLCSSLFPFVLQTVYI